MHKQIEKTIKRMSKGPLNIVDVGAYIGQVACQFLNEFPEAITYCVEPCPKNYTMLLSTLKSFGDRSKAFQLAISDKTGKQNFYVANKPGRLGSSQSNSLFEEAIKRKEWAKDYKTIGVDTCSMDDFVKRSGLDHIDLIKFNCEGGEYKIFQSQTCDWLAITDRVFIELHVKSDEWKSDIFKKKRAAIYKTLENAGFKIRLGNKDLDGNSYIIQLWEKNS